MPRLPRLLFTHTLYSGVGCASGVMLIALGGYLLGGHGLAAALSSGALVVSLSDMPTPQGHKPAQLLPAILLAPLITLVFSASQHHPWLLGVEVGVVALLAGLLSAWSRLLLPLAFGMILSLIFAIAFPLDPQTGILRHAALFGLGGLLYGGWGITLGHLLADRTRQQVLADAIDEFAHYLRLKARLHDPARPLDEVYRALAAEHAVLAEKLQVARDFVLTGFQHGTAAHQTQILTAILEAYEHALATHTDPALMRERYGHSEVVLAMGRQLRASAEELAQVAECILRSRPVPEPRDPAAAHDRIRVATEKLANADAASPDPASRRAAALLRGLSGKLLHALASAHRAARVAARPTPDDPLPGTDGLRPFISDRRLRLADLRRQLDPASPVPRFALRLAMAMVACFALGRALPQAAHGHWIMLTCAVVMRPNFSLTRQRHQDRILGTLAGCVLAGAALWLAPSAIYLLPVLFAATAVAHAFLTVQYRVTSAAASLMALLQLHLLTPGEDFALVARMADTILGASLGLGFSFLLPTWERHTLPALQNRLRAAASAYVKAALDPDRGPLAYPLDRKQFLDAIATLSQAVARMAAEPRAQRHPLAPFHGAVTSAYLLAAHLASARLLLASRADEFDPTQRQIALTLARNELLQTLEGEPPAAEQAPSTPPAHDLSPPQPPEAHSLLLGRLAAARHDARRLAAGLDTHGP